MEKKWIALLLALVLVLTATACGASEQSPDAAEDTGPAETPTVDSSEENSGESVTKPEDTPSIEVEDSLPVVSVEMTPDQQTVTDEDGTVLCYANLTVPTVTIGDNEAVSGSISDTLAAQAEQRRAEAQDLAEQARTNRPILEESGGFYGFSTSDTVTVGRADGRTISLLWKASYYSGGAHDNATATGWTFDAETGARLSLAQLSSDPDGLYEALTQKVTAELEAEPDRYFPQAADQVPQLLEGDGWYLTDEGLVVLAAPELLAPYAAGTLEFTVAYDELAGLLDEQWLPEEAAVSTGEVQIALTTDDGAPTAAQTVHADADGAQMVLWSDGNLEDFRIWRVSSSDGVTWYRGACCYAANRLEAGTALGLTAMLPDVMTNTMVSYRAADGSTVYWGVMESGKDGSVFLLELSPVVF